MSAPGETPRTERPLRVVVAGSVDDGKSTLIGRLLHDAGQLPADHLEAVAEVSRRRRPDAEAPDLALITDGLRAERQDGITIDVAYRFFSTRRRAFVFADAPGHVSYTRNMVTGASSADAAVLLVDAAKGVTEQTRRHLVLASALRVPHVVVAVNKMDLVGWAATPFEAIGDRLRAAAARVELADVVAIPVCALEGDNLVLRSARMPWYSGPPLLEHLEQLEAGPRHNLLDARMPVQWIVRADGTGYRGYAGQIASGVLRVDDEVLALPSGLATRIAAIDTFDGELREAYAPMSVTLRFTDDVDVTRGDVICRPGNRPTVASEIETVLCWLGARPAVEGTRWLVKSGTQTSAAVLRRVVDRVDLETLGREPATTLRCNETGRVVLHTSPPLVFDSFARNRVTGSLIVIDPASNDTVAAGMIRGAWRPPVERDVIWDGRGLSQADRTRALGHRGATIWITGLPASGKSSVGAGIERALVERGRPALRLDGDNLRHGINSDLGFARSDRAENVRRTAHVACLLAEAGVVAVVALVSPFAGDRALAREIHDTAGVPFVEVFLDTPLAVCEARDPKGHYRRARRGELDGFTGVDAPYEVPAAADVRVGVAPVDAQVQAILDHLDGTVWMRSLN